MAKFTDACVSTNRGPWTEKRVKREPPTAILKEALIKGKWLWHAAFLCLVHKYYARMSKDIFIYWFEGISTSFERIMNEANLLRSYDGLLWTLRSLQALSNAFILPDSTRNTSSSACFMKTKFSGCLQLIWRSLMHGLQLFSNLTAFVDASLLLLGSIVTNDQLSTYIVPQDVWDLKLFKQTPSASALYFITCYFSHRGSQGDFQESLRIRKSLLLACLSSLHKMESVLLNEHIVYLLPAATFALSVGCYPFGHCYGGFLSSYSSADTSEPVGTRTDGYEHENQCELFECSIEALARIYLDPDLEASQLSCSEGVCLPKDLSELLLNEMDSYVLEAIAEEENKRRPLSEVIFICTLFSYFICGSWVTRKGEKVSSFVSNTGHHLLALLDWAVKEIQKNNDYLHSHTPSAADCESRTSLASSFRSFVRSPIFVERGTNMVLDAALFADVIESTGRLLKVLVNHYERFSESLQDSLSSSLPQVFSASGVASQIPGQLDSNAVTIMDIDLDVDEDSKDMRFLSSGSKTASGVSISAVEWKMGMITLISSLLTVLGSDAWDALFDLMKKECDNKVSERMLYCLCQQPHGTSLLKIECLVNLVNDMIEVRETKKLDCSGILIAINQLLCSLLSKDSIGKCVDQSFETREFDLILEIVGQHVIRVAESGLFDWLGRAKLVDCICNLVLLSPSIGQAMIGRLLLLLQDPDYRVRFKLAGRISILFQTWEGHEMLFEDICSNLGVVIVLPLKGKLVTAKEVLAAGPQPSPRMETAIVTLMHLSYHSETIEMEAVFMMCVVSAIDPAHRELVNAALDELSTKLQYSTRFKYLEQLMACILFYWVDCGVNLVALVETRQLFVSDSEPGYFIQYCCQWLLPALLLHEDNSNLNWVSQVTSQPLTALSREHFVPIFAVCMVLHCSKKSGSEKGAFVLQSLILQIAALSENERDKLIKKNMVSIVSHILSLATCASDPPLPFFPRDAVSHAIQMVVDGFLDMDDRPTGVGVVDKINIFRPDRVFMFVMEMHYQIQDAVNHRHKCEKLAGIEVLVDVLGHRVAVASTANYILNLVGQLIAYDALEDQCCRLISALIKAFPSSYSKEVFRALGDQLQFLVSKLVAGIISSKTTGETCSSRLALLSSLTVDFDPSLYNYVRELEPFPEIGIFDTIRQFHEELCKAYSPREHLLDLVKRSSYLPPRLLLWSVQALHKKWLMGERFQREGSGKGSPEDSFWHLDPEIIHAVWTLVHLCSSDDAKSIRPLVSDFVCKVGIGDPHSVVFHLPGDSHYINVNRTNENLAEISLDMDIGISEGLLAMVLKLLGKYLMDDSARIVDITSQVLRGILSTEKGQRAMLSFDSYERSLLEIHSKGVDFELVQKFLLDKEIRSRAESTTLKDSALWETSNKTFETWICPLVYSLIGFSKDVILRLCQDIVLLKAEVAELLLAVVMVDLAKKKDPNFDLHELISSQVQRHILTESNKLTKSVQVFLSALNELRTCHVKERSTATSTKRESTKNTKLSSHGSRSRPSSVKATEPVVTFSLMLMSSSWEKVYWLTIDYLVVAKSALICGSYFTTMMYVEHWCEENFNELTLGKPDFSHLEVLPDHIEVLLSAFNQINEPDSLYGIIQSHKLTSQVVTHEHEGNWSKALEYYDLLVRSSSMTRNDGGTRTSLVDHPLHKTCTSAPVFESESTRKPFEGLIRSLQQIGCMHLLDVYCQGLTIRNNQLQQDMEFSELQYEAAWRTGNWDFLLLPTGANSLSSHEPVKAKHFNNDLHRCLKALREGDSGEFHKKLQGSKQELLWSISCASEESTEHIYSAIIKLQILYHLGVAWNFCWTSSCERTELLGKQKGLLDPVTPSTEQLSQLDVDWSCILNQTQLHMGFLEPFIAFRRVLLQILGCDEYSLRHLLQSASILRKGFRFSQAAAALHEFKLCCARSGEPYSSLYWHGRLEEAKLLRAQGQHEIAIGLADYVSQNCPSVGDASDVHRLVGKWLAETRSSNSRTILEKHLKPALSLAEQRKSTDGGSVERRSKSHFHLAHYADALFRSYEERLNSSEWQTAMRLRKLKTFELEALMRRLKNSRKEEKDDYVIKIRELQRQLSMDEEEAEKLEDDKNNFLSLALEGYKRCLVIGDKYDVRMVFRLVSLWFNLSSRQNVINNMLSTIDEVQSYKFIPLVYQIASRMGSSKNAVGPHNFQFALVSLVKKMAIDHPYHTIFQLLALANGDRIKDKQRSRNSFVVDMDKIISAKKLLDELCSYRGAIITQMRRMVEIYIKLAEMETKKEDIGKKIPLPRDIRSTRQLELVPVITASIPIDRDCCYPEGSFPHFKGLGDSVKVMNGINAPKVVECLGSDGKRYRQLAKSGNDDLRQDAVMEQFFGLVNTFLQSNRNTQRRRLGVRTYKVIPFTPSAGVLEWVDGTIPLGEYLTGSTRNGGAHARYGLGDWSFPRCREHMSNEVDRRKAFQEVCKNFRPVLHHFFLERFFQPADWFQKRLAYTRSVAASSMVGYIVGLGDRHSMNILIDQASAEVVHIDLGVAFEQGLMLKTPERVPFRLTRDIIDGMGITGVEGVFRRCCEETLSVMRTNKEALLTIVEVFIHDPLYKWALSPLKALQRQKEMDDDLETNLEDQQEGYEGNKDAARALMRVKQKLDGYEEGELRSVHGQVQQLIQDAIDPERLCQMFPGWGAWL